MRPIKTVRIQVYPKTAEKSKSSLVMKYFFIIFQIISGFGLGFLGHKSMLKRYMWKSVSFLYASSFILIFILALYIEGIPILTSNYAWVPFYLAQYVLVFLSFLFMAPDKTYCQLHHDLESIDSKLRVRGDSYNVEMKLLVAVGLIVCIDSVTFYLCCIDVTLQYSKHLKLNVLMFPPALFIEIVHVAVASIFYAFYCRMRTVKVISSTDRADYAGLRQIYKSVADLLETYKSEFDLLILAPVVFNTVELMFAILDAVNGGLTVAFYIQVLIVVMDLIHMFSAAICAEMITRQVDEIIIILHDKLLLEREENRIQELQKLITYVSARRLKFRVYQVIPLDASVIGMVVNFCVTYLIVIIQFKSK